MSQCNLFRAMWPDRAKGLLFLAPLMTEVYFTDHIQTSKLHLRSVQTYKLCVNRQTVLPLAQITHDLYSKFSWWDTIFRLYRNWKLSCTICQTVWIVKLYSTGQRDCSVTLYMRVKRVNYMHITSTVRAVSTHFARSYETYQFNIYIGRDSQFWFVL